MRGPNALPLDRTLHQAEVGGPTTAEALALAPEQKDVAQAEPLGRDSEMDRDGFDKSRASHQKIKCLKTTEPGETSSQSKTRASALARSEQLAALNQRLFGMNGRGNRPHRGPSPQLSAADIHRMYPHVEQNPGSVLHQAMRLGVTGEFDRMRTINSPRGSQQALTKTSAPIANPNPDAQRKPELGPPKQSS